MFGGMSIINVSLVLLTATSKFGMLNFPQMVNCGHLPSDKLIVERFRKILKSITTLRGQSSVEKIIQSFQKVLDAECKNKRLNQLFIQQLKKNKTWKVSFEYKTIKKSIFQLLKLGNEHDALFLERNGLKNFSSILKFSKMTERGIRELIKSVLYEQFFEGEQYNTAVTHLFITLLSGLVVFEVVQ